MTDTQADLTERARRLTQKLAKHFIGEQFAAEDETCRQCVAMVEAALQSEREAAAAEARRAAITDCAQRARGVGDHADCQHEPGYMDGRLDAEADILVLSSPPAPQEDKR